MRNISNVLAALAGSLIAPASFVYWTAPPGQEIRGIEPAGIPAPVSPVGGMSATSSRLVPEAAAEPLTAAEHELVAWAYDRFALVGLDLPPVDIAFHDDTEPCGGHEGRYRGARDRRQLDVCVPDRGTFASHLQRQRTLVHELAHAWDHANLDDRDRSQLLEIVDASDWYAPESDWGERGVERFAETIVWGLYDQLRRPVLIEVACRELHADFRAITGVPAPGPLEPVCSPGRNSGSGDTKGTHT